MQEQVVDFYKEKEHIWEKISSIALELEKTRLELNELQDNLPDIAKKAAQSSKKTSEYRNRTQESKERTEQYEKEVKLLLDQTSNDVALVQELAARLKSDYENSKEFSINIKDDANYIKNLASDVENHHTLLSDQVEQIEALTESVETIKSLLEESETNSSRVKALHTFSLNRKNEIDALHEEIFGYDEIDEESQETRHIDGIKDLLGKSYKDLKAQITELETEANTNLDELKDNLEKIEDDQRKNFNDYISECRTIYDETLSNIRNLLPQALTAGLSAAYNEKIDKELIDQNKHESVFNKAIIVLSLISLIPFGLNAYRMIIGDEFIQIIKDTPYILSAMLPVYVPIFWLAYSSNKNYKLSKRLIEEYTHKGVISKTYEGLSNQINELDDDEISNELRVKLLFNIVNVNNENPGKLISDYNKSDHPLMDALDKSSQLADAVTKLAKIPGFSAIARKLDDKANRILSEESRKIEASLEEETTRNNQ